MIRFWLSLLYFSLSHYFLLADKVQSNEREWSVLSQKYTNLEHVSTLRISQNPEDVAAYSSRGDARMFLGQFIGARDDYEKMIELDPKLNVSHWRLGIAYFYLSDFTKASRQFEIYHQYDDVDRENGIWKFMSQYMEKGLGVARQGLLHYKKDDRPPYPWLYEMFAGNCKPVDVFRRINEAKYQKYYETRVLFHAHLYVGIFLELTGDSPKEALAHLRKAAENEYGRSTGTYMWQIARLHYTRLLSLPKLAH